MQDSLRDLDIQIGQNLKRIRKQRNISQARLGDALGITFQQIQKYESGTNRISTSSLIAIGRILETNILDFLPVNEANPRSVAPIVDDEALRLVRLFKAIQQPAVRQAILTLIRDIAKPEPITKRPLPHP